MDPLTTRAVDSLAGGWPPKPPRRKLGAILLDRGLVNERSVHRALSDQRRSRARLGNILVTNGDITPAALADGLASQSGYLRIPVGRMAPQHFPDLGLDPFDMLALGFLPWRHLDGALVVAVADPQDIPNIRRMMTPKVARMTFALASRPEIEAAIEALYKTTISDRTRDRCPETYSARRWQARKAQLRFAAVALTVALAIATYPLAALALGFVAIVVSNTATTLLRLFALTYDLGRRAPSPAPATRAQRRPVISILIALRDEDVVLRRLIAALEISKYPKALMDVILVVDEDDVQTPIALAELNVPPWIRVLQAPKDALRTKPRALNYALPFCRGDLVGIYDAEDRPEVDQLDRFAAHFEQAPAEVACAQGYLDFYNSRQNWLSRCFTIEYAIWFRVLLRGVQRLGIPIPLGGTTVFFRRAALERIGGWDSYNVTEDAELGMRLARLGYRTEMVQTTTFEEANCVLKSWIPQRSRWLKGYIMTWLVHMRSPTALWRDLGSVGFVGFQVLFLGAMTAYLATPLFWALWFGLLGGNLIAIQALSPLLWQGFLVSMILGQAVMLSVALRAVLPQARRHLIWTVPTLLLYWPLGAVAAYRAVLELVLRPFHWSKTPHGL